MKRLVLLVVMLIFDMGSAGAETNSPPQETASFGRFGNIHIYRRTEHPGNVVLFVSGDGGWNSGVVDMARQLAGLDSFVVGIDIVHYLKAAAASGEKCTYAAGDFEVLSQYLQKKYGFPRYTPPVLVGYSSGATLVYALLAQAPAGTFAAAISLGFCPDLDLAKPLCHGYGLEWKAGARRKSYIFLPARSLQVPWIDFQGEIDQVCNPSISKEFVRAVGQGKLVLLPRVGHGFSVTRNWLPQFKEAFRSLVEARQPIEKMPVLSEVNDLPLIPIPSADTTSDSMAIFVSGDGGWAGLDRDIGETLARHGIPVVGWSSLQYFWSRRTPQGAADDLARVMRYYMADWHKKRVILIGYSLGADVLPFMVNRLPEDLMPDITLVALLGPSPTVSFEFHVSEWLGDFFHKGDLQVFPEVQKLRVRKILCVHGAEEQTSVCRTLDPSRFSTVVLAGSHHFDGKYGAVAEAILKEEK